MTTQDILSELAALGNETTKKIWLKHGVREPYYGVKFEDLKKIQKRIKKSYALSMELYATGNSDAMYLAGLIADPTQMTHADLQTWADGAYWYMLSEYTVAGAAAANQHGLGLALNWIESSDELMANTGWATLAAIAATKPDDQLDLDLFEELLHRAAANATTAPNRVRYTMNGFIIAVGTYLQSLSDKAYTLAQQLGKVKVDMGGTACKVPIAAEYIAKVRDMGKVGNKRKNWGC